MNIALLLPLLSVVSDDIGKDKAIQIAHSYRSLGASISGPQPSTNVIKCDRDRHVYVIEYDDITSTWVDAESGQVVACAIGPRVIADKWDATRRLSNEKIAALAQSHYNEAGHVGTLRPVRFHEEWEPRQHSEVDCSLVPSVAGVEYHYDHHAWFSISYDTGRLRHMTVRRRPSPPDDLRPLLDLESAEAIALEFWYQNWRYQVLKAQDPMHLCIWRPHQWPESKVTLPESYRQRAIRNEGVLVYAARYVVPWFTEEQGPWDPLYNVVVDAMTGQVLSATGAPPSLGGGASKAPAPVSWDLGPGEITVYRKGRACAKVQGADIERVRPVNKPNSGVEVTLKRARLVIPVLFDPRSGLLWLDPHGKHYGRPTSKLLQVLRSVCGPEPPRGLKWKPCELGPHARIVPSAGRPV